jgi:hypothetical protein
MTIPVVAEVCSATGIIRPEPLHTVSDRVTRRRTVRHRRRSSVARTVIARAVGGGQRSAYDCTRDQSSGNRSAPSPTSPSPLHGLGNTRNGFDDRKRLADRCRTGGAYAGGKQG